jgi:hypothetical protein
MKNDKHVVSIPEIGLTTAQAKINEVKVLLALGLPWALGIGQQCPTLKGPTSEFRASISE